MKTSHHRAAWASLLLAVIGLAFVYPFLWMFFASFKTNPEIFRPRQLLPGDFDVHYYTQLFGNQWIPFWRVFANSLFVSFLQAVGAVALSALAGFVFAKHRVRGHRVLFVLAVTVIVIPRQTLAVPLFTWLHALGLSDSLFGVILPGMVSGLGILYFTQVFRHLPDAYLDVARLAGASELRVFLTVVPLIRSSLLSYGLIHFILAWHEHLIPLLVLSSETHQTLPLALASLYGSSLRFPYAVLMAASVFTLLPSALLFALLYRRFKSALSEIL